MGTIATDMFTLSKLQRTKAQKRAKIIDQRFFWPPSVMSKRTSSATVSAATGPPPPALGAIVAPRLIAAGATIGAVRETTPARLGFVERAPTIDFAAPIWTAGTAEHRTTRVVPRVEARAPVNTAALETAADITDAIVGVGAVFTRVAMPRG